MSTKNTPGSYDCYPKAEDNEPTFTLLGRDPLAPDLVEAWAGRRDRIGGNPEKVAEARAAAQQMREFEKMRRSEGQVQQPTSGRTGDAEIDAAAATSSDDERYGDDWNDRADLDDPVDRLES